MDSPSQANFGTVSALVSDHPWGRQSGRLREVIAHGKDQQNKRNNGLINLHKNIIVAAIIRQIETNLFDFFTSIHSSDETLCNILEQITVTILWSSPSPTQTTFNNTKAYSIASIA